MLTGPLKVLATLLIVAGPAPFLVRVPTLVLVALVGP